MHLKRCNSTRAVLLRPSIFQPSALVKHRFPRRMVFAVGYKVAVPFKLKLLVGLGAGQRWLYVGGDDFEAVLVEGG